MPNLRPTNTSHTLMIASATAPSDDSLSRACITSQPVAHANVTGAH